MTQTNNEREALIAKKELLEDLIKRMKGVYSEYHKEIVSDELTDTLESINNLTQISQNEQQEEVAPYGVKLSVIGVKRGFEVDRGTFKTMDEAKAYAHREHGDRDDVVCEYLELYTSPPKQAIPDGWKIVPIESDEKMKDEARAFLTGLELGVKTFESMSEHLRLSGAYLPDWFLNSKGHINKMAKAHYIYESMLNSAPTISETNMEGWA